MIETIEKPVHELGATEFDVRKHNGWVTIENPATGQHRTFLIQTVIDADGGEDSLNGKRIVSLLIGGDRDGDTMGFGFADLGGVRVWRRHLGTDGPSDYERFARLLNQPKKYAAKGLVYLVEGRCRRCNRLLTHPDSVRSGLGPVCGGR